MSLIVPLVPGFMLPTSRVITRSVWESCDKGMHVIRLHRKFWIDIASINT